MGEVVAASVNGGRGSADRLIGPKSFVSTEWLVILVLGGVAFKVCWVPTSPSETTALVFVGARGGVGTTSSAALAAAALGRPSATKPKPAVILCDLDPYNAGIDVALGLETQAGFRWRDFMQLAEAPSNELLTGSLPNTFGFDVLAWGQAISDQVWSKAQLVLGAFTQPTKTPNDAPKPSSRIFIFDVARSEASRLRELLTGLSLQSRWFVVCPTDVTSVHAAARVKPHLPDDYELIIRLNRAGGVSTQQVGEALGKPAGAIHTIESDPKLDRAMNRGEFTSYCQSRPKLLSTFIELLNGTH
jgi:hypothetical protein